MATAIRLFVNIMKHFVLFFILFASRSTAQVPDLYNHITNDVHQIRSRKLNQDRQVYIHVPKTDTTDTTHTFPILYLLDGENHFHIVSAYVEYLRHWKVIPPMIVVGIVSVNRVKDLTPVNSLINFDGKPDSSYKTSGGNELFLDFIQQELMPYIEATYKTSPFRIFAGHSFGGLTVINCMLTRPDMFGAYVAISPSFWFGNKYVLRLAEQKFPKLALRDKKLFYSVGNEEGAFRDDVLKFDRLVQQDSSKTFQHQYKYYFSEDHMTEPVPALYDALRFIYRNWTHDQQN
ncbi:MAG: alpha/beta hydrolase [Chitinophagaceae bacterium]|nr:MAG: alpha/beta hydrolase [Chitinophagaceae bacterium]